MLGGYLRSLCRFRKTSLSISLIVTYGLIGTLYIWDQIRYEGSTPEGPEQLLLDDAWLSLQTITESPHEYVSRKNDVVHDFILQKVRTVTENVSYAEVSDDYTSNNRLLFKQPDVFNSTSQETRVISFESSNVLVKIEGTDPSLEGLLVSAHFDSVPTGFGATDDGMGVATLLALLSRLSEKQPLRTVVFNFNNNEEFGLLGASAFFNHSWSKIVHYVLNLEGAGAGNKAVLFRTSDSATSSIYKQAVQEQPFGNSMYQQGFYERYISSETDYKIYEQKGLRGWDIAFYKPRVFYHTAMDSISQTSKASLWQMMSTALQIVDFVAFEKVEDNSEDRVPAIYFDVLGLIFITMKAKTLFTINCILLAVVPLIILSLEIIISKRKTHQKSLMLWLRFPLSFLVSYLVITSGKSFLFRKNPLIFSRNYFLPTFAFFSSFVTVNYLILSFLEYVAPTQDLKTVALVELSFCFWALLLLASVRLYTHNYEATGVYLFTILFALTSLSAIIGLLCSTLKGKDVENVDALSLSSRGEHDHEEDATVEVQSNEEPDERAPLLRTSTSSRSSALTQLSKAGNEGVSPILKLALNYDWSLQFLALVPIATFFAFTCLSQVLDAVNQTCQDGFQASWNVSLISMLGSMLVALPLLPFSYKLNYFASMSIIFLAACTGISTFIAEPFTSSAPLKLRFSQHIDLTQHQQSAVVNILGRQGAGIEGILKDMPSVKSSNGHIKCHASGQGSETCTYNGPAPNVVSSAKELRSTEVMSVKVLSNNRKAPERSPYEPIYAELQIKALENRLCSIKFNSSQYSDFTFGQSPVKQITVFNSHHYDNRTQVELLAADGSSQDVSGDQVFKWGKGIDSLQLHKLDFEKNFYRVGIQWIPKISSQEADGEEEDKDVLGLQIRCFWGDYDSVSIVGGDSKRKVPAYDELLKFSPASVSYANREAGMVIFNDYIEL
ncbi:LADA_0H06348g1_1 [Lachancea dasiensis]|uniref:Peptide hydrolase n=1 Tax=Lachancea dasiensis TaxID=1072105 RepID=A0A1G4K1L5_9SACH|nr:LADA_0H06348g1_1 [Lachancea dasiensis]